MSYEELIMKITTVKKGEPTGINREPATSDIIYIRGTEDECKKFANDFLYASVRKVTGASNEFYGVCRNSY
jgi:hypothetical protein